MDGCPNRILSLTVYGVCIDDGFAGRSLSLVSKRIRDTSRGTYYVLRISPGQG